MASTEVRWLLEMAAWAVSSSQRIASYSICPHTSNLNGRPETRQHLGSFRHNMSLKRKDDQLPRKLTACFNWPRGAAKMAAPWLLLAQPLQQRSPLSSRDETLWEQRKWEPLQAPETTHHIPCQVLPPLEAQPRLKWEWTLRQPAYRWASFLYSHL